MADDLDALIDEVIVDASDGSEQLGSFLQAFEDRARLPFLGRVVGVDVSVETLVVEEGLWRGIVATCRRGGEFHTVSLLDVDPIGPMPLETRMLLDGYRRWAGAPALSALDAPRRTAWTYPSLTSIVVDIARPLGLYERGDWDPATEYWGESDEPADPLLAEVIAAGVRPCFEMEQVLPGVVGDDWDSDPIVDAAELHRAGLDREAAISLEALLDIDERCVDAWAHLGMIALDRRGPGAAVHLYETGVAIGEASLPDGFGGVLRRGWIDNRPFIRCLHGLGLCAWRQRRWDDAEAIFTALVWLDPAGSGDALACLDPVRARRRWISR
jgi:hypothetical protein